VCDPVVEHGRKRAGLLRNIELSFVKTRSFSAHHAQFTARGVSFTGNHAIGVRFTIDVGPRNAAT
jgi:hypothetical protein